MTIQLESIDLKKKDLLFSKNFINELGGKRKAKEALLNIIDRYFNSEYIDWELIGKEEHIYDNNIVVDKQGKKHLVLS
jgi:hypothetical protein